MKKLFAFFFFALSFTAHSQYNFSVADSVLASFNKPGSPGATVLVRKEGKVIYQKSGGYANIEKGEAINDKTLFNLASDTKQFTASCIIMLEQKGKLKLDDKLSKYFPEFPDYAQKITIQDLLNHTAGLVDYRTAFWIAGKELDAVSNEDIRKMLKATPLNFEPKTEWSYSNSNYWCLVQIVEQLSGMPIGNFADKNIFKPLKMKDTRYHRDVTKLNNGAIGYAIEGNAYAESDKDTGVFGGSGMFSTSNDMLKWLDEMDTKKKLGTAFWDAMLNGQKHAIGGNAFYSNALFFNPYKGKKWIYHGGDLSGYHSVMSYFPEEKLDIIVFTNMGDFNVMNMQGAIASQLFGFKFAWPASAKPLQSAVQLSKEVLEKYAGIYEAMGMFFEISVSNTTINVTQLWDGESYDAQVTGEASFTFAEAGADFAFENIIDGKAQLMKLTQDGETLELKRTNSYKGPDNSAYAGRFLCKSINAEYDFYAKGGKFFYSINGKEAATIGVIEKDTVTIEQGKVTYHRNAEGTVTAFTLDHPRVKGLEFEKI
ncbi:serine hydrolase domain-containing protein [Flavobacterium hauense]